jgi:hypothetical protein
LRREGLHGDPIVREIPALPGTIQARMLYRKA